MLLALLLLAACDETAVRHRGPIPASVRVRREYKASGGRLGNVVDEHELLVEGYPPLAVGPCEPARVDSRAEPKVVLLRCGEAPWRPVYLGERALLLGCPLAEGAEPPPLSGGLPELFKCHPRPDEVLAQAGEGRMDLLRATAEIELPLDEGGGDAWLAAVRVLDERTRAEVVEDLRAPTTAAGAWRAAQLGLAVDRDAALTLAEHLVAAPRGRLRDLALPALLLAAPDLPDRAALACRALPGADPSNPATRDLRAALALAMGEQIGACEALRLPEDACLVSLRCENGLCSDGELRARVVRAQARPLAQRVGQPGLLAEDVVAAFGSVPDSARRRTARLYYAQEPAAPPCSAAAPGEACACLETEVLRTRAVCEQSGALLRLASCEVEVDDAARTLRGRRP